MADASKYKGTGDSKKDAKRSRQFAEENKKSTYSDGSTKTPTGDKLADSKYQQEYTQSVNRARENMTDAQKKEAGLPSVEVYDPGDSDGDNKAVSPSDNNLTGGDPNPVKTDGDPFKDTKAAWDKLASIFGDKITALQSELEGRLDSALTPTDRETNNPFAGDDVPASKEMTAGDVKAAVGATADDVKALAQGAGEVGKAAAETAGAAAKDAGRATIKEMGVDTNKVGETVKTLAGLSGLFSSGDNPNSKVPDGNWKPKTISELFK